MRFKYWIMGALLVPIVSFASCEGVGSFLKQQDLVVTNADNILPGKEDTAIVVPTEKIPEKYREAWKDEVIVAAPRESVKPGSNAVPISLDGDDWDLGAVGSLAQAALRVGGTFFPPLLGLEAVLALLFRRKRKHYANAYKSILPGNGSVDLREGAKNVGRALGMAHSSESTKVVYEDEEREAKTIDKDF